MVHGGAWDIPEAERDDHWDGVGQALEAGIELLESGAPALEVGMEVVRRLEDDPAFDAGIGSHLNADGKCQLDALIMDGATLQAGAVAAVERIRNPIDAAALVMRESSHALLVGEGAERWFVSRGGRLVEPEKLVVEREARRHAARIDAAPRSGAGSTVGAVVRDVEGHVVCAGSTGGTMAKHPGRVGDTPLVGSGGYADDEVGAVASTGQGEAILRVVLAKSVVDLMALGLSAREAARSALERMTRRTGGLAGCIVVSADGDVGWAHTTPWMAFGAYWYGPDDRPRQYVGLKDPEGRSLSDEQ